MNEFDNFIQTLNPVINFRSLNKGDKLFNKHSLSIKYMDTFDHLEIKENGREIIFYRNYLGELWWGDTKGYWYYIKEEQIGG